jgi:hypothetical protein
MLWNRGFTARGSAGARQIKEWVRELLGAGDDATILVSEVACSEPGCPPVETVIAVMDGAAASRRYKIHAPLAEIGREHVAGLAAAQEER